MRSLLALLAAVLFTATPGQAQLQCGSPVIDRPNNDSSQGLVLVYRDGTQPLSGPGVITRWSFYNNENVGSAQVTPLLFERTGTDQFTIVAMGTSRTATSAGVQTHDFAPIFGSTLLQAGKQYTIGFTHRSYSLSGSTVVAGTPYSGIVDFTGYNNFTDQWSYAAVTAMPGMVLGTASTPLDALGFPGRIYSARFELAGVYPVAGCSGNPISLTSTLEKWSPGTSTSLAVDSPTLPTGVAVLVAGAPGYGNNGCGLFLPGIGELLFSPGSEFTVSTAALAAGSANLPVVLPNQPTLIGKKVLVQAVAGGVQGGDQVVALSNGLQVTIAP